MLPVKTIGVDNVAYSKLPNSCQQWELTLLLTIAIRATKIMVVEISVGCSFHSYLTSGRHYASCQTIGADNADYIATLNPEGGMLPVNYRSSQP